MQLEACFKNEAISETRIYSGLMHGLHWKPSIVGYFSELHQTFIWKVPDRDRQTPEKDEWLELRHYDHGHCWLHVKQSF
jgi:hypothetical protein